MKSITTTTVSILLILLVIVNNQVFALDFGIGIQPISEETTLIVNEEVITLNSYAVDPIVIDGVTMLPFRAITENLGFDVEWISEERNIVISNDEFSVQFSIDEDNYINNAGQTIQLGVKPIINNGRTLLPTDFFEKVLDAEVTIEGNTIKVKGYINWQDEISDSTEYHSIVADVPTNYMENDFYKHSFDIVDSPIEGMGKAIRIIGDNHSDDMFMGFYRKIEGLDPNTEYIFKFSMDLGTNVVSDMMGIGGSPGSSVYVKAGVLSVEPMTIIQEDYFKVNNFDKSNQAQSGTDMKVVTNMEKPSGDYSEGFANKSVIHHFITKSNNDGEVFLIVGTDSGFEGITEVYYDNLQLSYKEATPYNLSVVQESYYTIETEYVEQANGATIGLPKASGFINPKNQAYVNSIISKKIDELTSKYALTHLYPNYTVKGDLLSIALTGAYATEAGDYNFYDCINIDMLEYNLIQTKDFVKQDDASIEKMNKIFKAELEKRDLNEEVVFNNSMKIFYENEVYLISFVSNDTDSSDTLIYIFEEELKDVLNY